MTALQSVRHRPQAKIGYDTRGRKPGRTMRVVLAAMGPDAVTAKELASRTGLDVKLVNEKLRRWEDRGAVRVVARLNEGWAMRNPMLVWRRVRGVSDGE